MPTARTRKPALQARLERENTHDEIYEKIYVAILEHRLHPGTKLVEERLAEIFGVSRARVREVLARLAHEQIVELIPQRGAYVAKPSIEQALDVFEARRLIEPAVLRRLIETLTPEKLARLRQHQELELDARRRDDKRAVVRLSGEFHTLAAELAGNTALARSMRELSMLTCLIIFLYDAPTVNELPRRRALADHRRHCAPRRRPGRATDAGTPGPHRERPEARGRHRRSRPRGDLQGLKRPDRR